jgi:hypothetical protein
MWFEEHWNSEPSPDMALTVRLRDLLQMMEPFLRGAVYVGNGFGDRQQNEK